MTQLRDLKIKENFKKICNLFFKNEPHRQKNFFSYLGCGLSQNDIYHLIDRHDVISFDIFDTLLIRPYVNPYHLMKHIEKFTRVDHFEQMRLMAESQARQKTPYEDITLDEIYDNMPDSFGHLKKVELEFEQKLLKPHPWVQDLYQYAKKSGKKIAFISDMYLPKSFLKKVLDQNGYDTYDYFYLSGETKKSKSTGNLFKQFLQDTNLNPRHILHIGDSDASDVIQAQKVGMDTFHIPKICDLFFRQKAHKRFKKLYQNNPHSLEISLYLSNMIEQWIEGRSFFKDKNHYWNDFGYVIGGPVAYGFCSYILNQVEKNNIKSLLCIARDGYPLKKMIDMLTGGGNLKTYYVYAQRILRVQCLLEGQNEYKYDIDLLLSCLKDENIPIPSSFNNRQEKEKFVKKYMHVLEKGAIKHRRAYREYLNYLSIDPKSKIVVVDSGAASFSAQRLISKMLNKKIAGIYTTVSNQKYAKEQSISYHTWCDQPDHISNITGLIEFILMAPEPPVIGLNKNKPVYQTVSLSPDEIKRNKLAQVFVKSMLDFGFSMKKRLNGLDIVFSAEEVETCLDSFNQSLNKLDQKMLSSVRCPTNASHSSYGESLLEKIIVFRQKKSQIYFFFIKLFTVLKQRQMTQIKLFGFLPFIKKIDYQNKSVILLFNVITLIKIKKKDKKNSYYLFKFFKIITTRF